MNETQGRIDLPPPKVAHNELRANQFPRYDLVTWRVDYARNTISFVEVTTPVHVLRPIAKQRQATTTIATASSCPQSSPL